MSIIVPSNHTRIGAWVNRTMYMGEKTIIINCHARVSHKQHRIHGKLGLQICYQNTRRPYITSRIGWVSLKGIFR